MKKRIATIIVCLLLISFSFGFWMKSEPMVLGTTAQAVGDLTVDWGVPEGNPIFNISNMAPGQEEVRKVVITNNSTNGRPVAIRSLKTSETGNLSTVLDFEIKDGPTILYSDTLDKFFENSSAINGVELFVIDPGQTKTIVFTTTFQQEAGNEFQDTSVVFDLIIGIAFDIPEECQNMQFKGLPIFGTDHNDKIKGTNGNDLIIVFEGNDNVNASNGNDCIVGGEGNDKLNGSNGNDVIIAGSGNDTVDGSNGNDRIFGGDGNDKLNGKNGNDYIEGGDGDDTITGGNGDDTLYGNNGNDKVKGDLGTDECDAEIKQSCEL